MADPRILIMARQEKRKGRPIQFIGQAHCDLLLDLGALPVVVPGLEPVADRIDELVAWCHGVLFVEGGDVGPEHRGEADSPAIGLVELDPGKDVLEFAVLHRAMAEDMPILGVCRGAQLINIARGGRLHRDIMRDVPGAISHLSRNDYDGYRHPIQIEPASRLGRLYATETIEVTSVHHQANRTTGERLAITAWSPDGLTEAVEDPDHSFLVGVQFHPERQIGEHPGHRALYSAFVDAARERAGR